MSNAFKSTRQIFALLGHAVLVFKLTFAVTTMNTSFVISDMPRTPSVRWKECTVRLR